MRGRHNKLILGVMAVCSLATSTASAAAVPATSARHAIKPAPRVRVAAKSSVLRGDVENFDRLGRLDRRAVFSVIPAYRSIRNEKLTKRDARYHFLLRRANEDFDRALQKACREFRVSLVVEEGQVEATGMEIVDLTSFVCKEFTKPSTKP